MIVVRAVVVVVGRWEGGRVWEWSVPDATAYMSSLLICVMMHVMTGCMCWYTLWWIWLKTQPKLTFCWRFDLYQRPSSDEAGTQNFWFLTRCENFVSRHNWMRVQSSMCQLRQDLCRGNWKEIGCKATGAQERSGFENQQSFHQESTYRQPHRAQ